MSRLEVLQEAMRRDGLDALLLGGEGAGQFAAGHTRIGVHMPGSPIPTTLVPVSGAPHVVTADPDGALGLPADHVHGMMWNPATLVRELPGWLGGPAAVRIGVDALSPGGRALVVAALPGCVFVDATRLLAEAMMAKAPEDIRCMEELAGVVAAAARAALEGGRPALYRALHGLFPITYPKVGDRTAHVAVRSRGLIAEARIGPGDPGTGEAALDVLSAGRALDEVARTVPPGVEVVGLGWSFEPPLIRSGRAFPEGLTLVEGAVLAVHWEQCGVTVAVGPDGVRPLGLTPKEAAR